MAKKLLSKDLDKLLVKLETIGSYYGVKKTPEYKKLEDVMSKWKIDCVIEEQLTPRGKPIMYYSDVIDEYLDF